MNVLSIEARAALRAAEVAGLELPASITRQVEILDRTGAELAALPRPERVPTLSSLVAGGLTMDRAEKEHARLTEVARSLEARAGALRDALSTVTRRITLAVAEERDNLIVGMRPLIDALIEEARPLETPDPGVGPAQRCASAIFPPKNARQEADRGSAPRRSSPTSQTPCRRSSRRGGYAHPHGAEHEH